VPLLSSKGRLRSRIPASEASLASTNSEDLLKLQKLGVMVALKEAKQAELERTKILALLEYDKSKKWKVSELNRRYKKERVRDHERIKRLLFDYESLQQKNASGELQNIIDSRNEQPINSTASTKGPDFDRFSRMRTLNDIIAWKRFCGTFDKLDEKAERKFASKVDVCLEKKRLNLLRQKKGLLNHLIQVQCNELRMTGLAPSCREDFTRVHCNRSEASCATFVTRGSRGRIKYAEESQRPHFVPPLLLPTSK